MGIRNERRARDMDLKKAMLMGLDECHIALRESYSDLSDDEFRRFPLPGHMNIATLVMHVIQQHDDFNGILQHKSGRKVQFEWHHLEHEERWVLWGLSEEKLPKPGDKFPTVAEVAALHDEVHKDLIENIRALSQEDFTSEGVGPWPRVCDPFFRAIFHANAHIRQIWFLRGVAGIKTTWPVQHYA